jgi:NADH-quinone oxidoreductase subunit C
MISEEVKQDPVISALLERFPDSVEEASAKLGEPTVVVKPADIVAVSRFLKMEQKFVQLSSVTCVDWLPREPRFEVVYHLRSVERNLRFRVKARLPGDKPEIDSVFSVWRGCDWYEREVFDLFGVVFHGHPNLTRLMMPEGWKGHPLRKDYPVHGYKYSYADEQ